jgi:hypothetical protein
MDRLSLRAYGPRLAERGTGDQYRKGRNGQVSGDTRSPRLPRPARIAAWEGKYRNLGQSVASLLSQERLGVPASREPQRLTINGGAAPNGNPC